MANTISNSDDVIDSRDVIARIEELKDDRTALADAVEEAQTAYNDAAKIRRKEAKIALGSAKDALQEWDDSEEAKELKALESLASEAEGYAADWVHGEALIRDSHFQDYAQQMAEDIGAINRDASWPNNCIDWDRAATELQMDYTSVDFDGVTYWVR